MLAHALERVRPRLRLAVVYGGRADDPGAVLRRTYNPRPWKSYEAVALDLAGALAALGFAKVEAFPEDKNLAAKLAGSAPDLVWLNTAGVQGDAPMAHAPALLEMFGIPYVGPSPLNAATLDAKHVFKTQLQGLGLPTPPFATWAEGDGVRAAAILDQRAKPGELKVGVVEPPDIAINFKKAHAAGLKIPYAFFELAWYVYDAEGKPARIMGRDLAAR